MFHRVRNHIRHHKNWWDYYRYKYLSGKKGPFTFIGRQGWQLEVPRRMLPTYKECFFDTTYTKGFPSPVKSPEVVVDIGANVGYFSFSVFAQFPNAKVFAFEPIAANFQLLEQYQQQHPQFDLHVYHQAVNGDGAPLTLHYDAKDAYTTAATLFNAPDQPDAIKVPSTTLPAIMEAHKLAVIDWLKLDCEGAEYDIIYQTPKEVLDKVQQLSIETHIGPTPEQQQAHLAAFLQQQGFIIKQQGSKIWAYR
mgnify:CR=1 FL=1